MDKSNLVQYIQEALKVKKVKKVKKKWKPYKTKKFKVSNRENKEVKSSFVGMDQVGECQYVEVTFDVDPIGPVIMPLDLTYDSTGKLMNVKMYWQILPEIIINDFADFLKSLISEEEKDEL